MRDVKGVFFDLYGTLLIYGDMNRAWEDWFQAIYERFVDYGSTHSREELADHLDRFFARPYPNPTVGLSMLEMRVQRVAEELGLNLSAGQLSTAANAAVSAWQSHISVDPDVATVLETLRGSKRLALISNFDHPTHAHKVLRDSGLTDFFDSVTFSGEVGLKKPDPAIFEIALNALSLEPADCVYVGDTEEDVKGAWAAEIPAVIIDRSTNGGVHPRLDFGASGPTQSQAQQQDLPPRTLITGLTDLIPLLT